MLVDLMQSFEGLSRTKLLPPKQEGFSADSPWLHCWLSWVSSLTVHTADSNLHRGHGSVSQFLTINKFYVLCILVLSIHEIWLKSSCLLDHLKASLDIEVLGNYKLFWHKFPAFSCVWGTDLWDMTQMTMWHYWCGLYVWPFTFNSTTSSPALPSIISMYFILKVVCLPSWENISLQIRKYKSDLIFHLHLLLVV